MICVNIQKKNCNCKGLWLCIIIYCICLIPHVCVYKTKSVHYKYLLYMNIYEKVCVYLRLRRFQSMISMNSQCLGKFKSLARTKVRYTFVALGMEIQ